MLKARSVEDGNEIDRNGCKGRELTGASRNRLDRKGTEGKGSKGPDGTVAKGLRSDRNGVAVSDRNGSSGQEMIGPSLKRRDRKRIERIGRAVVDLHVLEAKRLELGGSERQERVIF